MKTETTTEPRQCFAIPGETIIDFVTAEGVTEIYSCTLDEVRAEYPRAVQMSVDDYRASKCAAQDAPGEWVMVTEERFKEMLNVLPPAASVRGYRAFMVGEPYDHHARTGRPRFDAFKELCGEFFSYSRPMTFAEFREFFPDARYEYVS